MDRSEIREETPSTTPLKSNSATPEVEEIPMDVDVTEDADISADRPENSKQFDAENGADEAEEEEDDGPGMSLPLSKIKKIFRTDMDYNAATPSAVYATGLATELFVQYFTEQAALLAKMDKRKKVQYKDLSNAVAHHDSLAFLRDTIPKTVVLGDAIKQGLIQVKGDQESTMIEDNELNDVPINTLAKGQQTLNLTVETKPVEQTHYKKAGILDLI